MVKNMKRLYIWIGCKSPAVADYIIQNHSNKFSRESRESLAIGRAIRTNWGKKSLGILEGQIREVAKNEKDVQDKLRNILKDYKAEDQLLLLSVSESPQVNETIGVKIDNKIAKTVIDGVNYAKLFSYLKKEQKTYNDIREFLTQQDTPIDERLIGAWWEIASSEQGILLSNLVEFLETYSKEVYDSMPLLTLAQSYALNKKFAKARDVFYQSGIIYGFTPWLSYVSGQTNKQAINYSFQMEGYNFQDPHPLLSESKTKAFFERHERFIEYYYTEEHKDNLKLDYVIRSTVKASAIPKQKNKPRVLFITDANWSFLTNLINEMHKLDVELDVCDYSYLSKKLSQDKKVKSKFINTPLHMTEKDKSVGLGVIKNNDGSFYEKIHKADIIFCEWGNEVAALLSKYAPPDKKLIIRIHSYEVFTHWHMLLNMGGVDGLIFVAPHIKNIFMKNASPEYYDCPKFDNIAVIPNIKNFDNYTTDKNSMAKFTLGMAGYNKRNKGLLKALKILKQLKSENNAWTLHLAGHEFDPAFAADYNYWIDECKSFIEEHGLQESVIFDGFQDMGAWLPDIGYILSVSDREGTHEALLEGVASGCIPIIIDWSMVKDFGGVKELYPFLTQYVLSDENEISSLQTDALHEMFDTERLNISVLMREHSEAKKVTSEVLKFLEKTYAA